MRWSTIAPRGAAAALAAGLAFLVTGCGDGSGPNGPGGLAASVTSPNGAEGAAVIQLNGRGIRGVKSTQGSAFTAQVDSTTTRVILVRQTPGTLEFSVDVEDRGAPPPTAVILQVADGNNVLRASLSGYRVEFMK